MTCVSMGNPHVVLYCRDVQRSAAGNGRADRWKRTPIFPRRINVHFVAGALAPAK